MSFSINVEVVEIDGTKVVRPTEYSPLVGDVPVGRYSINGHLAVEGADWGESVGVTTPIGSASASIFNPAKRGQQYV